MIKPEGPNTVIHLDTPAGLVEARTTWAGTKVERVEIDMPVSFVEHLDHPLEVEGLGTISVDVAFGGCYFALIDAAAVGFELARHEARDLVDVGNRIQGAAVEQIAVRHPELPGLESVEYPMFVTQTAAGIRNATIIFPGRVDRSPCGTGTAARLAVMQERRRTGSRRGDLLALDHRQRVPGTARRHHALRRPQRGADDHIRPRLDLRKLHAGGASIRPVPARLHAPRRVGHRRDP